MCWSYSIRYSFKRCLALTVFLFKCRFFAKFLWFDDPSGRSAAGRMAPMAQFQLPAVRVVNPTELSARFCGERSRFSLWVRAANMSWRGSDRPMKCEHVSPRVYAALTVEPHLVTQDAVRKEGAMLKKPKPRRIQLTPNSPRTILQCLRSRTLCELRGSPKRSLLPDRRRLGDCNTRVLLSGT